MAASSNIGIGRTDRVADERLAHRDHAIRWAQRESRATAYQSRRGLHTLQSVTKTITSVIIGVALLAYVFRKATKMDVEEYAARQLFTPLGIDRWFWKRSPSGLADTEGGLYLEARNLAKIWYLFLRNGMWDGRQIVSPDWVKTSVAPTMAVAPVPNAPKQSLTWWLYPDPREGARFIWGGSGFGGQGPMTFPQDDMSSSCSTAGIFFRDGRRCRVGR